MSSRRRFWASSTALVELGGLTDYNDFAIDICLASAALNLSSGALAEPASPSFKYSRCRGFDLVFVKLGL